jgi:hypothetical protein
MVDEQNFVEVRLRIVSSRADLNNLELDRAVKSVHLAYRPSGKDIVTVTKKFPNMKVLQLPQSYRISVSDMSHEYLTNAGVMLLEGGVSGHRKDLSDWAVVKVSKEIIDKARDKLNDGL